MNRKLYIWGWWQGNNLGDNWIRKVLKTLFPEAHFVDTSVKKFEKNSFVICGGGGLFVHDVIAPWNKIQKGISYGMLGLGAEFPHESHTAEEISKDAKFFFVRDQYSLDCMHVDDVERSYDLTFALPLKWTSWQEVNKKKVFYVWRDGKELLDNKNFRDYIMPGSSYKEWKEVVESYFDDVIEDDFQTHGDDIEERIDDCGFVVSGRYHGIVAAIQKGLPFVAIDICPKIRALLGESGLEEYCIKISEIDKVEGLIKKAFAEIDIIREKEKKYLEVANTTLKKQIKNVQLEVLKELYPLNIVHYGSYWMKKNDVVNTMADDLEMVCKLKKIDLKAYSPRPDKRIESLKNTPNGMLCTLDKERIIRDVKRNRADAIILNSGGLYLTDDTFWEMRKRNVTTIGISLSDPDVFPYNGKLYANKFDLFYTNSQYSLENEYNQMEANVAIMPFAASCKHHYYMPEVERKYDVVIVAHARDDRRAVVEKLSKICSVGTYGNGWKDSLGTVNGKKHVEAINSGKMYLSFARTVAGFDNVKVGLFEAMACNQVVITSYMEELQYYFDIGTEILCYQSEDELYELIKYYLHHPEELEAIRKRGFTRFLNYHTYEKRWNNVLEDVYREKGLIE